MFGKHIPSTVGIGLAVAIVADTALQVCWKVAVATVPASDLSFSSPVAVLEHPIVIAVFALMCAQFANWMIVLSRADLSFAQPITALSYVSVSIVSALYLEEHLGALQIWGIALVLLGVWFISQTEAGVDGNAPETAHE